MRLRLCGSRGSNGRDSGAATADAPLDVGRRVVTAASGRIEEVGRRSWFVLARNLAKERFIPTVHRPPTTWRGRWTRRRQHADATAARFDSQWSNDWEGRRRNSFHTSHIAFDCRENRPRPQAPSRELTPRCTPPPWSPRSSSGARRSSRRRPSSPSSRGSASCAENRARADSP